MHVPDVPTASTRLRISSVAGPLPALLTEVAPPPRTAAIVRATRAPDALFPWSEVSVVRIESSTRLRVSSGGRSR